MIIDAYVRWTIITGNGRPQTLLTSNHSVVMTELVKTWRKLDVAILPVLIQAMEAMVLPMTQQIHQPEEEDSKETMPMVLLVTMMIALMVIATKIHMMTNQITLVMLLVIITIILVMKPPLMILPLVMTTILLVNTSQ